MTFPKTRKTLIFRLTTDGAQQDWLQFLSDYWLAVCHFVQQRANLGFEDAEDVAAEAFEVLLRKHLLERWLSNPSAKLRTLLCTVAKQVLANQLRVRTGRIRLLRNKARELLSRTDLPTIKSPNKQTDQVDEFYSAWIESILLQTVESLVQEYDRRDEVNRFKVLHARICLGMATNQISQSLNMKVSDAEYYYKAACKRLTTKLEESVRQNISRYCDLQDLDSEFDSEWCLIGQYLKEHGGLEEAIAIVYRNANLVKMAHRQSKAVTSVACRLAQVIPAEQNSSVTKSGRTSETKEE